MTSNNSFFDPPILDNKAYFIDKGGLKMNQKEKAKMEIFSKSQVRGNKKDVTNNYGRSDTFTSEFSDE